MGTALQDLRYALRTLRKQPSFTIVVVLALALGIGANSAMFTIISAVMLRPLPYHQPKDLVLIRHLDKSKGTRQETASYPDFQDWQAQNKSFADMATFGGWPFSLMGAEGAEQIRGARVSANFLQLLGVKAIEGRTFLPEEEKRGAEKVVLLSYALWQRAFGRDEKVIGRSITLSNQQFTIIGILPPTFRFPFHQEKAEIWTTNAVLPPGMMGRGARNFQVIARLKPGVSLQTAQTELAGIADRLEQEYQKTNQNMGTLVVGAHDELTRDVRPALWILFGAVAFVLLIACFNVANLLLTRATSRQKELAIRTGLGASSWRIVRQLLTESLVLSFAGGLLGLLLAMWGVEFFLAISPASLPRINSIGIDSRVLTFTLITSILTTILFGLAPALKVARPNLNEALKEGGKTSASGARRDWLRGTLVVCEIAFAFILLTGAGLLINSFIRLNSVELGFRPENVLTVAMNFPARKHEGGQETVTFLQQAQERIKGLPGVRAVSCGSTPPFGGRVDSPFEMKGRAWSDNANAPMVSVHTILPDYFETMGIRLLQGRSFTETDDKAHPGSLIVNDTFARRFFPNENPLGHVVSNLPNRDKDSPAEYEIVGVAADVRAVALDKEPKPQIYTSYRQTPWSWGQLVIRADKDADGLGNAVRQEIKNLDAEMPVTINRVEKLIADSILPQRFNLLLLTIFASTGLLLAGVGIYGVMSHRVAESTHEIGIRMALGAQASDVLRLILRPGALLTLLGVGIGISGAIGLTRLMQGFLFGIKPTDLLTFVSVAMFFAFVALIAAYLPARRATKVDPLVALRYE